ncbi:unnamed protein product [Adineta steineri]|uniref:F-box domain-containing protein n=1 Tax=Adineta steineri TaxID=433720 RepID=A0A820AHA7_9BILA|nr:unnamed protein product [Adineta steineri]CAF4176188.1 unnamed protein product [Adineta steineri]
MNFNVLPNEILLAVFEYLNGNDLFYTFYGLNARINALLYKQYRCYYFDFFVLPKRNFDLICQQHIPMITDRILALHLSDSEWTPGQVDLFFSHIPSLRQLTHLRSLSLSYLGSKEILGYINSDKNNDYIRSSFSSLTNLNISIAEIHPSTSISFLQNTPNLHHLNIKISGYYFIDGRQWEDLIRDCLPKLRTFHLSMTNLHGMRWMTEEQIDELMNSFRTSFWIDEHRWFVRCISNEDCVSFETVSNAFHYTNKKLPGVFKSTDSQDNIERLYTTIDHISDVTLFNQPISSKIYFPKLHSLSVKCPINDQYWSMISNLHDVSSLSLDFTTDFSQSKLQALLNRMPYLRTLTIHQKSLLPLPMSLFNCTFPSSIHYLDLENCEHYFNEKDCIRLTRSSLTSHCERLDIPVKNLQSIIILVRNMINLCVLRASFPDEQTYENRPSRICNDDEDIQWLIDHLPSTCAISRDPSCFNDIRIWIK